ncbi:MAG: hypothetical protein RLZZ360_965 [Candidatus Parcubacteria bacterium]
MEKTRPSQLVTTLIAVSYLLATQSAVASEAQRSPVRKISIAALETHFAVSPTDPEVDPNYVEARVREYFADIPVMIGICGCESEFRQFREDGTLLVSRWINPETGKRGSSATGVCQITYKNHYPAWSDSPETNVTTLDGNLAFARELYLSEGTAPWNESKSCWG